MTVATLIPGFEPEISSQDSIDFQEDSFLARKPTTQDPIEIVDSDENDEKGKFALKRPRTNEGDPPPKVKLNHIIDIYHPFYLFKLLNEEKSR